MRVVRFSVFETKLFRVVEKMKIFALAAEVFNFL